FDRAGPVGGRVKSHCSRSGVRPQCDLMPKAPSKTPDFGWKVTMQTDYLGVSLMHFGEMHGTRRTRARCGLRPDQIRFGYGRWIDCYAYRLPSLDTAGACSIHCKLEQVHRTDP